MPSDQIPEEAAFSPDSSLASSNENVSSTRSTSSNDDGLICPDPYPQQIFNRHSSIRLAQMAPQRYQYEPKLDDLLVSYYIPILTGGSGRATGGNRYFILFKPFGAVKLPKKLGPSFLCFDA